MTVDIREHTPGGDLQDFIKFPHTLYRDTEAWVPPLRKEVKDRLSPKHNPFFKHAQVTLFTAWRGGEVVGRCSAQIDHEHLRRHQDQTGFFGFFDTVDDPEVALALLGAAERWLKARGMRAVRGPLSLSINEEVGVLTQGFDKPPMIMMPYHHPYQANLIGQCGYGPIKELLAWHYEAGKLPQRATRAWDQVQQMPEVTIRSVNVSRMDEELHTIMEVFNDAWSDNWGFVPATEAEVKKVAKDLKLIVEPELAYIVEIHGRAAAICVALPNLNAAIQDLDGRLRPTNLLKLLWRIKVKHLSSARLMMLGVRKEFRHSKRYGALPLAMYVELYKRGTRKGYNWGELSWTLEDNAPINIAIRALGGRVSKRYRLYEKSIEGKKT